MTKPIFEPKSLDWFDIALRKFNDRVLNRAYQNVQAAGRSKITPADMHAALLDVLNEKNQPWLQRPRRPINGKKKAGSVPART